MSSKTVIILATACALVSFATGCSKQHDAAAKPAAEEPAAAESASSATPSAAAPAQPTPAPGGLPGEAAVHEALAAKDYSGAVSRVFGMQGSVKRDQWEQYVSLQYEVRNALGEAAATDPKAAEALLTFNAMNRGR